MTQGVENDTDERMSLFEHLSELRQRLLRVTLSVLALGAASLVFSKWIYGLLMRPILMSLPPEASTLVYTSAIEEFNVLMKVGLYAGIFLSTPVLLWQIWGFVAPGLYEKERRFARPFVVLGTLAFVMGALFCYFMVLPPMFQFLLRDPQAAAVDVRMKAARQLEEDAIRFLRLGDVKQAGAVATQAVTSLTQTGEGQPQSAQGPFGLSIVPKRGVEVENRLSGLGRLIDATQDGLGPVSRPVLLKVTSKHVEASAAMAAGQAEKALSISDEAASLLSGVSVTDSLEFSNLWKLQIELAKAQAVVEGLNWTKPMLTMSQQLSLVLLLLLAFAVIFELPLIMAVLGMAGLLSSGFLFKYQRHAFVFCLILAAILTPTGDAINLALMAGPMFLCFELGVIAVWLLEKRRNRALTAA